MLRREIQDTRTRVPLQPRSYHARSRFSDCGCTAIVGNLTFARPFRAPTLCPECEALVATDDLRKRLGRRPIPGDWNFIGPRTSANNIKGHNRDASHPVNAILNYACAVLESHVRIEIISQGQDPTIGYLHAFEKYRAALVCDLMKPLRSVVDRTVLGFVQSQTFQRTDFTMRSDGVCRLNPEMARHIAELLAGLQIDL
jgi:hypothetical protein